MKKFNITVNGNSYEVEVEEVGSEVSSAPVKKAAAPKAAPKAPVKKPAAPKKAVAAGSKDVTAPLPGTVLDIKVKEGQEVNQGDVVILLEAMKMENEIAAPTSGKVSQILVKTGDAVNGGDVMISIE